MAIRPPVRIENAAFSPSPTSVSRFSVGIRTSSKTSVVVSLARRPSLSSFFADLEAVGVFRDEKLGDGVGILAVGFREQDDDARALAVGDPLFRAVDHVLVGVLVEPRSVLISAGFDPASASESANAPTGRPSAISGSHVSR